MLLLAFVLELLLVVAAATLTLSTDDILAIAVVAILLTAEVLEALLDLESNFAVTFIHLSRLQLAGWNLRANSDPVDLMH